MHSADDLALYLGDINAHGLLMYFIESMVYIRGTLKEEYRQSIAWKKNSVCQIHG